MGLLSDRRDGFIGFTQQVWNLKRLAIALHALA